MSYINAVIQKRETLRMAQAALSRDIALRLCIPYTTFTKQNAVRVG